MNLDERIYQDLGDLLSQGQIHNAIELEKHFGVASRAIPLYFSGNRNAKTVIINLNPGGDANQAVINSMQKITLYRLLGLKAFVQHLKSDAMHAGYLLGSHLGYFDLKTAVFLSQWPNSGIDFPKGFPITDINDKNENNKSIQIQANTNCLNQKLQLELLPYPSKNFTGINNDNISLIYPFIETVLDEIFRKERKYVIFAASQFDYIFRNHPTISNKYSIRFLENKSNPTKLTKKDNSESKPVFCTPIIIEELNTKKQQFAIIANTFSNQSFSRAYDLMRQYGKFCYETFMNYHNTHYNQK